MSRPKHTWAKKDAKHPRKLKLRRKPKPKPKPPTNNPSPNPNPNPQPPSGDQVYSGTFGTHQAERLLWRAGFGPRPGDAKALASKGLEAAIQSLTRPSGTANLSGPDPHDEDGNPLAPTDAWGHDHLWWLDRMVRSDQPLIERMTLVWHDWFANSNDSVNSAKMMLDQNELFRRNALRNFKSLLLAVTKDPAMLVFLNGIENHKGDPNENYAREVMELFTLGADRGAYTEDDVREMARSFTGFDADWDDNLGLINFRFDPQKHDTANKTVFGKTGNWDWQDACRLCVEHPLHASFFVTKLWNYFVPTLPTAATRQRLEQLYTSSNFEIRPVVEAILRHPDLHQGERMVKPPVVLNAGLLRALKRGIDTSDWTWICSGAGQQLFYPPNVAGWDDSRWLDTSTVRSRWVMANEALQPSTIDGGSDTYDITETPEQALFKARAFWDDTNLTDETLAALQDFARTVMPDPIHSWEESPIRAMRMNALRHLIVASPDYQTS